MPEAQTAGDLSRSLITGHISHQFDVALHAAIKSSIESMAELREAVCDCVGHLRATDMGPAQMILTMKACTRESSRRYRPEGDEYPGCNPDLLMDQIIKWAIIEYYKTVS
jgi:hypothetical protein